MSSSVVSVRCDYRRFMDAYDRACRRIEDGRSMQAVQKAVTVAAVISWQTGQKPTWCDDFDDWRERVNRAVHSMANARLYGID